MELLQLFITFLMIGFVSFGGGYAMIPVIEREAVHHYGWMSAAEFTDALSVAGMAPGPFATNVAIFIGYDQFGIVGAIVSTVALVLPSFLIVFILAAFLHRYHRHPLIQTSFYVLRPIVVALILYAAVTFTMRNGLTKFPDLHALLLVLIILAAFFALIRFRIHPFVILLGSGIAGIVIFT